MDVVASELLETRVLAAAQCADGRLGARVGHRERSQRRRVARRHRQLLHLTVAHEPPRQLQRQRLHAHSTERAAKEEALSSRVSAARHRQRSVRIQTVTTARLINWEIIAAHWLTTL